MDRLIYKILPAQDWNDAVSQGVYEGSADDARDGFIHLSTATQLAETARRHFAGQSGLVVVAIDAESLPGGQLKWETSRGGDRFPHLYGTFDPRIALSVDALTWDKDGAPCLPQSVKAG